MPKTAKTGRPGGDFEEVIAKCSVCGKRMKFVKSKGVSAEGWVCQKCGLGEVEKEY